MCHGYPKNINLRLWCYTQAAPGIATIFSMIPPFKLSSLRWEQVFKWDLYSIAAKISYIFLDLGLLVKVDEGCLHFPAQSRFTLCQFVLIILFSFNLWVVPSIYCPETFLKLASKVNRFQEIDNLIQRCYKNTTSVCQKIDILRSLIRMMFNKIKL